ncbi:hypothetical protein M422DRAFT_242065 [Sphaerobolus stellatus SS14]|nr:hypothetical protein M422DRAFT_242065 [Sphaerobolus stellatus SS14]
MSQASSSNSLRIKAKVSRLAKPGLQGVSTIISPPSPSTSPALPSPTSVRARVRTMTTTRRPSIQLPRAASPSASSIDESRLIPLPTSPPASTVSFSSHSSTSVSSVASYTTNEGNTPPSSQLGHARRTSLQSNTLHVQLTSVEEKETNESTSLRPPSAAAKRTLVARIRPGTQISGGLGWGSSSTIAGGRESPVRQHHEVSNDVAEEESGLSSDENGNVTRRPSRRTASQEREDEERAEAKSNRKIADLEITTKSLLSINATLEASKVRQAREIRDLRRKLREARLALPPKRFKLLSPEERAETDEPAENDEEEEEEEDLDEDDNDETFHRVTHIIEELLTIGRNALAVPAPSFGLNKWGDPSIGDHAEGEVLSPAVSVDRDNKRDWKHGVAIGSRVLTAEEAKRWTCEEEEEEEEEDTHDGDVSYTDTVEDEQEVERQVVGDGDVQSTESTTPENGPEDTPDDNAPP